jgi:predicted dehydrogenase
MTAEMSFPGETHCEVRCSMAPDTRFQAFLQVTGSRGELRADDPPVLHLGNRLRVSSDAGEEVEQVEGRTTHHHQLDAFLAAVRDGERQPTGGEDDIANMRVIDAVYVAAGMKPRGE